MLINKEQIFELLRRVKDPELPTIDVVELGIVREVEISKDVVVVRLTPTYSGCPAMDVIKNDISQTLAEHGIEQVQLETVLSPPWTTDWLSKETKEKLREIGIAPPEASGLVQLKKNIPCPRCSSTETECRSEFGSTACKALWYCRTCQEPFDYFKQH